MLPIAKNIKRYFSAKEILIICFAVLFSVSAGIGVFMTLKKDVVINDNGKIYERKTMKDTVGEVLEQNGITLREEDLVNLPLNSKLQRIKVNKINIKRAVPIKVFIDGREIEIYTAMDTVKDALAKSGIVVNDNDKYVGAGPFDPIVKDMNVKIVRVKQETVAENVTVPYRTVYRDNDNMDKGTSKVAVEGQEGVRSKEYKLVYEDGQMVLKDLINDKITKSPIDKIIERGTVLNFKTSRGEKIRYKKVLSMRATAYTSSYADTGKNPGDIGFGITRTGMQARKGIIAVDPNVIPLHTRLYIQCPGSIPDYGYAIAGDTGGAIQGNLIDLYFDSKSTVANWGVKNVKVYILIDQ